MNTFLDKLEKAAMDYEAGRMLRDDSEVEIDVFEDSDSGPGIFVSDYSEERGSCELVRKICEIGKIAGNDIVTLCNKHGWAYCLSA